MGLAGQTLSKAKLVIQDGVQKDLQRTRARLSEYPPDPHKLLNFVYDTFGARVRDGDRSRGTKTAYRCVMLRIRLVLQSGYRCPASAAAPAIVSAVEILSTGACTINRPLITMHD